MIVLDNLDVAQLAMGVAAGLVIMAIIWLISRSSVNRDVRELRQNLLTETERRLAAEAAGAEKDKRIAELLRDVTLRERAIANFNDERTEHLARLAELETMLANERSSFGEKLAVLGDAQRKLSDAFHTLTVEVTKK